MFVKILSNLHNHQIKVYRIIEVTFCKLRDKSIYAVTAFLCARINKIRKLVTVSKKYEV